MKFLTILFAAATAGAAVALAQDTSFEELLSFVFFEDETATADTRAFFCKHIKLSDPSDTCNAEFRVIDANSCKVEVIREFSATSGGGAVRDVMRAKEVFTVANLDLTRTKREYDPSAKSARGRFEAPIDIYRHEGFQYAFDLDGKGAYRACRIAGKSVDMPQAECVAQGAMPQKSSKSMSLLFNEGNFEKALSAVRLLQENFCPAGGNRT